MGVFRSNENENSVVTGVNIRESENGNGLSIYKKLHQAISCCTETSEKKICFLSPLAILRLL